MTNQINITVKNLEDGYSFVSVQSDQHTSLTQFVSGAKQWKYVNGFIKLKCSRDILDLYMGTHDPTKEITEAYGFWNAIKKHTNGVFSPGSSDVRVFVVGDGRTPRLAGLLAHMSKWEVFSIDPNASKEWKHIERLKVFSQTIEDFKPPPPEESKSCLILLPHAHVCSEYSLNKLATGYKKVSLISSPCCMKASQKLPCEYKNFIHYRDPFVLSPENEFLVYNNLESVHDK